MYLIDVSKIKEPVTGDRMLNFQIILPVYFKLFVFQSV